MDPFSFEQDVAPLRGSYFSTSGASGRQRTAVEQRSLQQNYLRNTAPLQDRAMNIAAQSQRLAAGQQAMEMNRLQLREQRDQMKQQREFAARLPESMSTLMGIMGADAEPEEKEQAMLEFTIKNPHLLSNPVGADVFRSVGGIISSQRAVKENTAREEREAAQNLERLAYGLTETGNVDALAALNKSLGDGRYNPLIAIAGEVKKQGVAKAEQTTAQKLDEDRRAAEAKRLEGVEDDADKARATQASLFQAIAKTLEPKDDGLGNVVPGALSPVYRQYLRDELPKLDRSLSPAQIEDMTDDELAARSLNLITRASRSVYIPPR